MIRSIFHRWARQESGAVAIEFVLLAPMLFALLFGIVCVGYAVALSHSVHQLASQTARVTVAGLTEAERRALAEAYLADASRNYPLLVQGAIAPVLDFTTDAGAAVRVDIAYALDGSVLELANGFLGLNWTQLEGSAYLAY